MSEIAETVASQVERARKELLDLTLKNPLLNYRLLRARGVDAVDAMAAEVFDALVKDRAKASFLPKPDDDDDGEDAPPRLARGRASRNALRLQTAETARRLDARLLRTHSLARTSIEEQGVNTLFFALGMVEWHESDASETPRKAPLILVPVSLGRGDVSAEFLAEYDDGEIGVNQSFIEKVKTDFGVNIPDLPEDADADETDADAYFAEVAAAVENMPRWRVDESAVALGFFSFQKLLMHRDLDPREWGANGGVAGERVITAIFGGGGFSDPGPSAREGERLDDRLQPADIHHVVDADSSQAVVVADVANGRDLVVQGPPGTGKSQTIVNLIADAIGKGKTVLFVSEKMAALEVVKRRLDEIGIGDACLELHSHKTSKRALLDELKRTMDLNRPVADGVDEDIESLARTRDELNRYADAVNVPIGDTGVSPNEAMNKTMDILARLNRKIGGDFPYTPIEGAGYWSRTDFQEKREVIKQLQLRLSQTGPPGEHVFRHARASTPLTPGRLNELGRSMRSAADSLNSLVDSSARLGAALRLWTPAQPSDADRLVGVANMVDKNRELAALNLNSPAWRDDKGRGDVEEIISAAVRYRDIRAEYDRVLTSAAWETDTDDLRRVKSALQNAGRGFLGLFPSREFKDARRQLENLWASDLPNDENEWIEALDALLEASRLSERISNLKSAGESALGALWNGDAGDMSAAASKARAYLALLDKVRDGRAPGEVVHALSETAQSGDFDALREIAAETADESRAHKASVAAILDALDMDSEARFGSSAGLAALQFAEQREILGEWARELPSLDHIIGLNIGLKRARGEGLGALSDLAETWRNAPDSLVDLLDKERNEAIVERAYAERPELADFNSEIHADKISRFAKQDLRSFEVNRVRVASAHHAGLPSRNAGGEVAILLHQFARRRRHMPIRRLMLRAGNAIQAIKPVFMMSPLSIANYIPHGALKFDVVIFDEASQVRPVDALGALMRGERAVVVGDTEQLPPTSFFDSMAEPDDNEEEESVVADIESILEACRAKGMPEARLKWHYRSRHESLIALSNREFYGGDLVVFASPDYDRSDSGLKLRHLTGTVYESRFNRGEARIVAKAVMEHAKNAPDMTLGAAAFSARQAEAIQDELETLRRQDTSKEGFFAAHPHEPFFVKNLENVQGDERDVIYISVGYGRDANGRVSMRFGPLNNEGGHRRLNVLITRARRRCEVFTNLRTDDIRTSGERRGVLAFKAFLKYAETGILPADAPSESGRDFGSPFQKILADSIRKRGYEVHEEVASGGRFIDMAVVDPNRRGRYALGVEFDGATYHRARWARDRDRLRDQVLEGLGWRLHRVWSTDYFANPEREVDKVEEAILRAIAPSAERAAENAPRIAIAAAESAAPPPAAESQPPPAPEIEREDAPPETDDRAAPPYEMASPQINLRWYALHEVPYTYLVDPIAEIVRAESPVHQEEVARRIASAVGIKKVGSRIRNTINREIAESVRRGRVNERGEFLWDPEMEAPTVRNRADLPPQHKKIEMIAPEEIAEAVRVAVEGGYTIERDEAISNARKMLGFARASANIQGRIAARVRDMEREGVLTADGDSLRLGLQG